MNATIAILLGLSLGSFANVCIYRIPMKISIVAPRSFCPHCHRTLQWYELIPVVSFLLLKGKCGTCRSRISLRYPLVELAVGVVSIWLYAKNGATPETLFNISIFTILLIIAVIDWTSLVIPNALVIAGLMLGGTAFAFISTNTLLHAALSALLATVFTFLARAIGNFTFKKETMGIGDVKLAALIGFFIGFEYFLIAVWLAAVVGIIFWTFQRLVKGAEGDIKMPFGSFLSATFLLIYLAPGSIFGLFHYSNIPMFHVP